MVNESLRVVAEDISLAEAEAAVFTYYGIQGKATRLTSERDKNFRITTEDGREYALRVSNPAEPVALNDFQVSALQHIAAVDATLPLQRVIPALTGHSHLRLSFHGQAERSVRLVSYLPGVMMFSVDRSPALRRHLGATLAKLGLALRGFFHPAAGYELGWDIKNTAQAAELLVHEEDVARRRLAEHFCAGFNAQVAAVLPTLRAQVVHNDFNLHNVLVDKANPDHVSGILDFGDMVHTALINDVAVGASYHLMGGDGDPWQRIVEFVSAYHEVCPLEAVEIDLLYDLIAARCVITVAITGWRAKLHPENSAYILRNNARAWDSLTFLTGLSRSEAQRRLRGGCVSALALQ
jgi:Ser/Thr protein kinase RdoA (MazF antagonist)